MQQVIQKSRGNSPGGLMDIYNRAERSLRRCQPWIIISGQSWEAGKGIPFQGDGRQLNPRQVGTYLAVDGGSDTAIALVNDEVYLEQQPGHPIRAETA